MKKVHLQILLAILGTALLFVATPAIIRVIAGVAILIVGIILAINKFPEDKIS